MPPWSRGAAESWAGKLELPLALLCLKNRNSVGKNSGLAGSALTHLNPDCRGRLLGDLVVLKKVPQLNLVLSPTAKPLKAIALRF
jgi:hypothetical protein